MPPIPRHEVTVYCVTCDGQTGALYDKVSAVVERAQAPVNVVQVARAALDTQLGEPVGEVANLVIVRDGRVVGRAAGSHLPTNELRRVVQRALDWAPAHAPVAAPVAS